MPTPFPNRHFSPPADNLDWGGWDEQSNQKQSEMPYIDKLQSEIDNSSDFVKDIYNIVRYFDAMRSSAFDTDNEKKAMIYREITKISKKHDNEVAKQVRHAAAEIVLSVGSKRDVNEAHRDIMNLKF